MIGQTFCGCEPYTSVNQYNKHFLEKVSTLALS